MIDRKPCKGQGRAKNFNGCLQKVIAKTRKHGLCRSCYKRWLLTTAEGAEVLSNATIKAKKTVEKKQKEISREEKLAAADYKVKLQDKINEIVRLIDIGLPCLATQRHPNQMHAGHIYSRGAEYSIRYNLHNIHRQSAQSNWKHSDDVLLRQNLVAEYGQEYMDFIDSLRQTAPLKFSNAEYRVFYKRACAVANELRRKGRIYNWRERLSMRSWVNIRIGIYSEHENIFTI